MTSRLLLTLLAFFTGLSAQESAVQARAITGTTQVAAVFALATVQTARANAVLTRPTPEIGMSRCGFEPMVVRTRPVAQTPAVLTRIDRAHE